MHETVSSELKTGADVLAVLQLLELGSSLGLGDFFRGNLASSDLLDGLDGGLGCGRYILSRASDGGVEQACVRVDGAGSLDLGTSSGSVAEFSEAGRPLDSRFAAEKRCKDGNLRLVEVASEGAGAGECNDESVAAVVCDALLTTEVLGLLNTGLNRLFEGIIVAAEELSNPLGEVAVLGTVGYEGEIGLSVGERGEDFD